MITRSLLLSIALPALIAGGVLYLAARAWRRDATPGGAWSTAPALGLAFVAGYAAIVGWPPFPPVEATQRLVYEMLVASFVLAVIVWRPGNSILTGVVRALFSFALPWLLLRSNIEYRWSTAQDVMWVAGLGAATFLYGLALDATSRRNEGVVAPLGWFVAWTGLAIVLVLSASALLAQIAAACAAALGAVCVVGLLQPRLSLAPGGTAILSWVWAGLSINAAFYAEGSPYALVLLALAGLGGLATRRLPQDAGTWKRVLTGAWATAPLAALAVIIAWRS
jgi:hypothetical protein